MIKRFRCSCCNGFKLLDETCFFWPIPTEWDSAQGVGEQVLVCGDCADMLRKRVKAYGAEGSES